MIIRDGWKEPTGKRVYAPTDKELEDWAWESDTSTARRETSYWRLADLIRDGLGPEGGTMSDIYHYVASPLGLTSSDTVELVRKAKARGYLE